MSMAVMERRNTKMARKVLSISSKRQITIPQKFYQTLGFGDEAECIMRGDELIIRPVKTIAGGEFAEQILSELIQEGFSGETLLAEFKKRQAQIRPAAEMMILQRVKQNTRLMRTYSDRRIENAICTIRSTSCKIY